LADGSLDVALADETLVFPGMARRPFMRAEFVAIANPRHRLARSRRVTLASLCAEPLIAREPGSGDRSVVERFLADAGIAVGPALALGSTEAVKRAVEAGLGVGIVPRLAVEREATAGRVRVLRVPEITLARTLYEVWDGGRRRTKAAQAFHCVLEHAVRGTLPKPPRAPRAGR
jgi:DNA-binding transcriptional LysR family regulator